MLLTLGIHNMICNCIASFSVVLARKHIFVSNGVYVSRDCYGSVVSRESKEKGKGGNPVLFDHE
jgi:hypothetical protein